MVIAHHQTPAEVVCPLCISINLWWTGLFSVRLSIVTVFSCLFFHYSILWGRRFLADEHVWLWKDTSKEDIQFKILEGGILTTGTSAQYYYPGDSFVQYAWICFWCFFLYFTSCRIVGDLYILLVNILYCWFPTKKPIFGAYSFFGGGQIGQIDQQWYGLTWTSYLSHEQNASLDWLIMVDWLGINRLTG